MCNAQGPTARQLISQEANQQGSVRRRPRAGFPSHPGLEPLEGRVLFSTFTVTSTLDDGTDGTLRWAVAQANVHAGADVVAFAPGVSGTVTLTGTPLVLSDTSGRTTISGPGARVLTVSGNRLSRVFEVDATVDARIDGLTISDGHAPDGKADLSALAAGHGGGILNAGTLTLTNCAVRFNTAGAGHPAFPDPRGGIQPSGPGGNGGGIFNSGTLTLVNDTVNGNVAGAGGGGIGISHNGGNGGGLCSTGSAQLVNVTLSGNAAGPGGNGGNYNMPASGGSGGGVCAAAGTMTLTDCTISANRTGRGGIVTFIRPRYGLSGVGGGIRNNTASVSLNNSIVARNLTATGGADDINGAVGGASDLIGIDVGMTGITNGKNGNRVGAAGAVIDPRLSPLGDYGGPTDTMALLADSPALGAGDVSLVPRDTLDLDGDGNTAEPLPVDQRGLPRLTGGRLNIGSCQ